MGQRTNLMKPLLLFKAVYVCSYNCNRVVHHQVQCEHWHRHTRHATLIKPSFLSILKSYLSQNLLLALSRNINFENIGNNMTIQSKDGICFIHQLHLREWVHIISFLGWQRKLSQVKVFTLWGAHNSIWVSISAGEFQSEIRTSNVWICKW